MSIIKQPILFEGTKGEKTLYALFDSGASLSCINPEFIDLCVPLSIGGGPRLVSTASVDCDIEVTHRIMLTFYINDVILSDEFLIVPGLTEEVIIGASTLQKWRIKLDFEHDTVDVNPKVAKLQIV